MKILWEVGTDILRLTKVVSPYLELNWTTYDFSSHEKWTKLKCISNLFENSNMPKTNFTSKLRKPLENYLWTVNSF